MTVGDLREYIEDLPDSMDLVVCHGDQAFYVVGLGTAMVGPPATYKGAGIAVVRGIKALEITVRDHA